MRTFRTLAAAAGLAACVLTPQTAQAGSNGQQIEVFSYGCWYSRLYGTNYQGNDADTGRFYLPYYGANRLPNHWFKYTLHVYCYDRNGIELGYIHAEVPVSQSSNWYRVYIEPGSLENNKLGTVDDNIDAVNLNRV